IIDMEQPGNALIVESLLAYMPYFLHPEPKKAFVVGYGGGITTRALTHTDVESIRVVELEPAVVDAGHSIKNGPALALRDPRVKLEFNDARNSLLIENQRYDIIAAQASHPWLAGASNVFTQEFFEIVKSRLNEGGYYSQWVNLFRMDVTTLRAIFQAFINTFPHVTSFANTDSGDFMLLGSLSPIYFDYQQIETRMQAEPIKQALAYHEVFQPRDLFWYYGLSQNELFTAADNAIPNRDTNILSEVRLSGLANKLSDEQNPYPFLFKHFQLDTASYFRNPEEYARHAYELGLGFLEWENPSNTTKLIGQLTDVSKIRADSLQHKLLFWQHNFTQATQWFDDHNEFLDEVYVDQMQIYLERNEKEKARAILEDIKAPDVKKNALSHWAYLTGDENVLKSINAPDNRWILSQQLRNHKQETANKLFNIMQTEKADGLLLRLLARHYLETGENEKANQVLKQLSALTENQVAIYLVLIEEALKLKNTTWTEELLSSIRKLDSDNEALPSLQSRLEASKLSESSLK
ncbi:MAG: fused MFS/spermidine synthase, partial [Gammaproteobacteria bacterium]|nr:fused MFS/spermidine synthase [Gammaproteobacteria bacterium]